MLSRLLQIRAVAGTIERYFALLTATLGADAAVHSRTETFFLANLADRAAQVDFSSSNIMAPDDEKLGGDSPPAIAGNGSGTHVWAISGASSANEHVKMALPECYPYRTRVK